MIPDEEWRPIPGYEGVYEASSLGRVRSLARVDMRGQARPERILKQATLPSGRLQVNLYRDGKQRIFKVHRLIALAFHGTPEPGQVVCHNDGDPANNRASNIRWGTASENQLDAVRHGTHREVKKTHCPVGHPLDAPNLVLAHVARGSRNCRACDRARSAARRGGVPFTKQLADEKYAQIMRGN